MSQYRSFSIIFLVPQRTLSICRFKFSLFLKSFLTLYLKSFFSVSVFQLSASEILFMCLLEIYIFSILPIYSFPSALLKQLYLVPFYLLHSTVLSLLACAIARVVFISVLILILHLFSFSSCFFSYYYLTLYFLNSCSSALRFYIKELIISLGFRKFMGHI